MAEFLQNLPQPQLPTPTPPPASDLSQVPAQSVAPAQSLPPAPAQPSAPASAPSQSVAPVPTQTLAPFPALDLTLAPSQSLALVPAQALAPAPAQSLAPAPAQGSTLVHESAPAPAPTPTSVACPPNRVAEHLMHKNRLQEYAQRSGIQLPVYQTVSVGGYSHAPQFRSTVFVDGETYTSPNTFSHRKAAEQDAAKFALENIVKKVKDQGCPLIVGDTVFCKLILNEFAMKRNLEKPAYSTTRQEGLLPVFLSSVVFDGATYTGEPGRNKKEAEQLAARAAIVSLLGNSGSATSLSELIKSKGKLYAAIHKIKDANDGTQDTGVNTRQNSEIMVGKVVEAATTTSNVPVIATAKVASSGKHPPHHQFKMPKQESSFETVNFPIQFVPPVLAQPLRVSSNSSNKRRKNKKKANKKLCTDAQLPDAAQPTSQAPSCSVAQ